MAHRLITLGIFVTLGTATIAARAEMPCESLKDLSLPHTTITSASLRAAGPLTISGNASAVELPAHCVVEGIARPTQDSEIRFEVWVPVSGWNGRYQQVGNGGWAGSIPRRSLAAALARGYATAGTDDGHRGGDASWAIGHPEKMIDFGYRAVHETSEHARAVIRAFYGKDPAYRYFVGCSDGGREALMEAQRYPEDFDGIIAGAPANDWSHQFTGFVWNEQALRKDAASAIPIDKLPAIEKASLAACDGLDGVKDGLVEDPRVCRFDPGVLLCKGADGPGCLTAPQVAALRKIYSGPRNPRTGKRIYPGYAPGAEAAPNTWASWIIANPPGNATQFSFGNTYYGQAVFEDPNWDFRTLNFDADVARGHAKVGAVVNSANPDLRAFRDRGGKLIQYHGWADTAVAPESSIEYYESVRAFLARHRSGHTGKAVSLSDFYRLFMVPGMGHCSGGYGPCNFGNSRAAVAHSEDEHEYDILLTLERWVEKGAAPERLIGSGASRTELGKTLTRPLCPYPAVAHYRGSGDPDNAASFTCAVPKGRR